LKGTWDLDRDPLAALRDGDTRLFEEFVRTEAGTLVGFFRRLGAGPSEAEDLTQEVFLKLFQSARTYQPQRAFGAFALRVARNAWIDHRRRGAVRPTAGSAEGEDDEDRDRLARLASAEASPDARAERRDELLLLAAAVRQLPERHLAAFELAVVQGLPYAEISELLDIPVGTVKSRVFNAVRRVRAALEHSEETR
jgi:RNA polymerase sigma-70 factor (ECF subfamily)